MLGRRDGGAPLWWKAADLAILGAFVLEAIAKIATFRLRYFYSAWNVLDAVVALTGVVDAAYMDAPDVSFLKALRVLRPLRTVNRVPRCARRETPRNDPPRVPVGSSGPSPCCSGRSSTSATSC